MNKYGILSLVLLSTIFFGYSQDTPLNKHGLLVIEDSRAYKKMVSKNPENKMMDLRKVIPNLIIDLKYGSTDNFMNKILYQQTNTSYLRKPAALALAKVQEQLLQKGLAIKIWDAYRPYSVTEKMWEPVKDERYAANPKYGSGHNRGIAVDLTLVDLITGFELNMGTGFDHFSDTAHITWKQLPTQILSNRLLLQQTMEAAGFIVLQTEWWHFYLPDARKYELMNLSFSQLKKITKGQQIK